MVKKLEDLLNKTASLPSPEWQLRVIQSEDCQSYFAWNDSTHEALIVDPKQDDQPRYLELAQTLKGYRWLGVIDTHTHADHVSSAAELSQLLHTSLIMHESAPSRRVHLRVSQDTELSAAAGAVRFLVTPGHSSDSLTVIWGPYVFSGDAVLYGDVGRDDFPTGDPVAHYESLLKLKRELTPTQILLPGHDPKGGRVSDWATQLQINDSLKQERSAFIAEAGAYTAAAPKHFKESLFHNFK